MCWPLILAGASLALGVANTVMSADAAKKNAQSQQEQLAVQATTNQANAALARQNADLALTSAAANAKGVLDIAKQNDDQLTSITNDNNARLLANTNTNNDRLAANTKENNDALLDVTAKNNTQLMALTQTNANTRNAITDINVGLASSISNFNDQVADGQSAMLISRGELEAGVSERNAVGARITAGNQEQTAQDALTASHQDEQSSRLNYARLKSTQRATLAANGVALDEGSALRIQTDTDYFSDVDGATIHANGIRAAMGYRQQESNSLNEATMDDVGAQISRINAATESATVQAQATGARIGTERDILNMKMSTSFEILQAQENALVTTTNATTDANTKVRNANTDTADKIAIASTDTADKIASATADTKAKVVNNDASATVASANYLNQGRVEATNYEMQAGGFSGAASAEDAQRNGIDPGAAFASTLVGGAASVAGKWYTYQQSGAFGSSGGGGSSFAAEFGG